MTDFALFRLPDGSAWFGRGPFEALAEAPQEGVSFYWNHFDLTEDKPWRRPAEVVEVCAETLAELVGWNGASCPRVTWTHPETEWFKMAFRRIRRDVQARRLEKMVPVLTERGRLLEGDWVRLVDRVIRAPVGFWGYACVTEDAGFVGATPELLFRSSGSQVTTMALAGTAKPGHNTEFLEDVKEIEEHELVAGYMEQRLAMLGKVSRQPRGTMEAGGLTHFQTHLEVELDHAADPTALVPWLHPTPAVGCLPREEHWLEKLREYRQLLNVPSFFGAPFGFMKDGVCHMVVSIRGLSWQGKDGYLPSGCGIVGGSAFDHEWRELRLKREAVMRMMGVGVRA